ncbi:hypothetical protein GCM10025768_08400 [Microbacterium pseudoresistens]|uniref:CHASE2 domain-containing sensor protein n=1 Tax=Microbacterium pseudoresistens TaxID=640634 RepID=A0A7Y9EVE4_9MICO|nr:hypothetical protein [Microbacterium pseudoresistens]NYD54677.1 CHASE2 domain-containing sensor protein [Microbacterium pseudoresistens]
MLVVAIIGAVLLLLAIWQVFVHPINTLRVLTRLLCGIGGILLLIGGVGVVIGGQWLGAVLLIIAVGLLVCANRLRPRQIR